MCALGGTPLRYTNALQTRLCDALFDRRRRSCTPHTHHNTILNQYHNKPNATRSQHQPHCSIKQNNILIPSQYNTYNLEHQQHHGIVVVVVARVSRRAVPSRAVGRSIAVGFPFSVSLSVQFSTDITTEKTSLLVVCVFASRLLLA